jgi:flagellar assembly factor FliW
MEKEREFVVQSRLGRIPVDRDRSIRFPKGLIGFENCKDFVLLQLKEDSPFLMLQSTERPELGLVVTDPFAFMEDFEIKVGDAERNILKLENIRQVAVLVTVSIPKGRPEQAALHLTGPILVNFQARLGLQIPQVDSDKPGRLYIGDLAKAAEEKEDQSS